MIPQQNDSVSLPKRYRKYLEFSTIITLGIFVVALYTMPKFETSELEREAYIPPIESYEIPPETQQFEKPPPPARPSVPIESESEDVDEDLTIEETDLEEFQQMDEPQSNPMRFRRKLSSLRNHHRRRDPRFRLNQRVKMWTKI